MDTLKILLCQIKIPPILSIADLTHHNKRILQKLEDTHTNEKLILLPELSTINYARETFDLLHDLIPELEKLIKDYQSLAKKLQATILFGAPQKIKNKYYISHYIISPKGKIEDIYNKMHIAQFADSFEKEYFTRSNKMCSFTVDNFKFGLEICYDLRFPEMSRAYREKHNVDVILHPCIFTTDETYYSWHSFVKTRAMENHVYLISLNRSGEDAGESICCPPWADGESSRPIIMSKEEQFLTIEINKQAIQEARESFPYTEDKHQDYN